MDYKLYNSCRERYEEEVLERRKAEERRQALYELLDAASKRGETRDANRKQ